MKVKNILIYAGSQKGKNPIFEQEVIRLAQELKKYDINILYGAGSGGLMGVFAEEYLRIGGKITGIIPHFMKDMQVHHENLTEIIWVNSMHERKDLMATKADAIIALPGGFGTLDELFEILTWKQLKLHDLAIGIFNIENFYKNLLQHIDVLKNEGFVNKHDSSFIFEKDPKILVEKIINKPISKQDKYNHSELI